MHGVSLADVGIVCLLVACVWRASRGFFKLSQNRVVTPTT